MNKKKIVWITGDSFKDVDMLLVPYLKERMPEFDIKWYIFCGYNSKVEFDDIKPEKIFRLNKRLRDLSNISVYKRIFNEIKVKNADLIYSDHLGLPYYYPVLSSMVNKSKVIHAAHNVMPYPVWPASLKWYVWYLFHAFNNFQMFSKHTAKWFGEHYPKKKMFYAPMVVKDFGRVRTDNYVVDDEKVNILFFGNVVANKRLDLLIDAVKALPMDIQEKVHLNICGNCTKMNKQDFIDQIGDCKSISTYFKRIPDEEIPELFTKHQFFMLPYEDVAQSGPHMIAYNYNLPVIASNIDGFAERVEDGENGFLFEPRNVESLRDAIIKAVEIGKDGYKQMKDNLHNYVEDNFSLEAVAPKYVEFFNDVMK